MIERKKSRSGGCSVGAGAGDLSAENGGALLCTSPAADHSTERPGLQGFSGRLALRPSEMAAALGVGRNVAYALCCRADFPVVRVGRSILVPVDGLLRWLADHKGEEIAL